ncbi:hypothetical protein Tco_0818941 [Tanacetum coccineum]
MNLENSSRPTQMMPPQRALRDPSPHSPTHSISQASQTDSSPAGKGKGKSKEKKPRPKKTDIIVLKQVTSEYNRNVFYNRIKDMITGKWSLLTHALKDHHKWRGAKAVVPGRRLRTADDVKEPNELSQDDTIPRPSGKPRPSKSQKSDSSKSLGSSSKGKEALRVMPKTC